MEKMKLYMSMPRVYLPEKEVGNDYFSKLTSLNESWFERRTGIQTRRRAGETETSASMAINACENIGEVIVGSDLIVTGSYTPYDTLGSLGHHVQRAFELQSAKVFNVSTGCCSVINAMEIAASFMKSEMSEKALIVSSEFNSLYSKDADPQSGHLWGDAASGFVMTKDETKADFEILDIVSEGLGSEGKGPGGINLYPHNGGIKMTDGKDVFYYACKHMMASILELLERNKLTRIDVPYVIPHQANGRIINRLKKELQSEKGSVLSTVEKYGNTGSTSTLVTIAEYSHLFNKDDLIVLSTFGGGYSSASTLLRKL